MFKGTLVVLVGLSALVLYTGCDAQSAAALEKLDAARAQAEDDRGKL